MDSYNKNFTLYFKTREKAILSRGEDNNYITDYPQDLYIYNHKLKTDEPLITYEWFPSYVKKISKGYKYPVFPEDFAYYLMEDNNTLIEDLTKSVTELFGNVEHVPLEDGQTVLKVVKKKSMETISFKNLNKPLSFFGVVGSVRVTTLCDLHGLTSHILLSGSSPIAALRFLQLRCLENQKGSVNIKVA